MNDVQIALSELEKVDFDINNSITKVLRIAQYRCDIKEILFCRFIKIHVTEANNGAVFENVKGIAIKKGLSEEKYKELYLKVLLDLAEIRKCYSWYEIKSKRFLNNTIVSDSISEIILYIKHHQDLLDNNNVSEGLAPLDVYHAYETKKKVDTILNNHILNYKRIINKVKDYLIDYLLRVESELLEIKEVNVMDVKKQLELLIQEGNQVREICYIPDRENSGIYDYISGKEYVSWLEKSKRFIKSNVNDPELYQRYSEIANHANSNGPEDFTMLIGILTSLLSYDFTEIQSFESQKINKLFISHSSKDVEYVQFLVQILNDIGIKKSEEQIFCSSLPGYGIPYGENIYEYLKEELNKSNIMVLFVLSHNYYQSAPCLNEMGAAWITSKSYNSILTPNFDFKQLKGSIDPTKISFYMNDETGLNKFKDKIVEIFDLDDINYQIWERDRARFVKGVTELAQLEASNMNTQVTIERVRKVNDSELVLQLRFVNITDKDLEFKYIDIELEDSNGNRIKLSAEDAYLEKFILHNKENRVEEWTFKYDEQSGYNPRRDISDSSNISFEIYN